MVSTTSYTPHPIRPANTYDRKITFCLNGGQAREETITNVQTEFQLSGADCHNLFYLSSAHAIEKIQTK